MQGKELELLIKKVINEMNTQSNNEYQNDNLEQFVSQNISNIADNDLEDLGNIDFRHEMRVPNAINEEMFKKIKLSTPARVGIWRTGPRYTTRTMLGFRADHAKAQDAVFDDVPSDFIKNNGWLEVQSLCETKDIFLTRPDLGRRINEEHKKILSEKRDRNAQVLVYIADGLSSTAVISNAKTTYQSIEHALKGYGINVAEPFFVKYGRVGTMDEIGSLLEYEVVVLLVGERPGLITSESMSCYMAYKPTIGMLESRRTVLSNIHSGGMPAVEAGVYIAEIVKKMLDQKASGLDLK